MNQQNPENQTTPSSIDKLDWDIQPSRNLWPNIAQKIVAQTTSSRRLVLGWQCYALAASIVVMLFAATLSYFSYIQTRDFTRYQAQLLQLQQQHIAALEIQHQETRLRVTNFLNSNIDIIDDDLRATVQAAMNAVDLASSEINSAIISGEDNTYLYALLEKTYEQEQQLYRQLQNFQQHTTSF